MRRTCAGEAGVKPGHILVRLGAVRDAGRDGAREHLAACSQGVLSAVHQIGPALSLICTALHALAELAQAGPRCCEALLGACSGAQSMRLHLGQAKAEPDAARRRALLLGGGCAPAGCAAAHDASVRQAASAAPRPRHVPRIACCPRLAAGECSAGGGESAWQSSA